MNQSNVLAKIVEDKRSDVEQRKINVPLSSFKDSLVKSDRSLEDALSTPQSSFIFECKKASPSKGLIRENFDLTEILNDYKDYASAISVLADEKYFQGKLEYITQASKLVSQPILCKDFFVDTYQVYEARKFGADAILLMLSVLDDKSYIELSKVADSLSLDVLTEVHTEEEMERAQALNAKIVGINNRDLRDLSIDLATTEKLVAKIKQKENNPILVSESGIETNQDVNRLSDLVDGFLIGSSIMAKDNIRHHCKSLIFGNIKICGLTRSEDARLVEQSGGTYGGLIFYPPSPRNVSIKQAKAIVQSTSLRFVGVFVDEAIDKIINIANALQLFAIQLHGNESPEYCEKLSAELAKNELSAIKLWKVIHLPAEENKTEPTETASHIQPFSKSTFPTIDKFLFDTFEPNLIGGTGKTFSWRRLNDVNTDDFVLAGGINPSNIKQSKEIGAYAIDLSSGVEESPGVKSESKITSLFQQLRT